MFYRLKPKVGGHNQNGRDYVSGDIVESDIDLVKRWQTKFELVHDEDEKKDTGIKTPDIRTPAKDTDSEDSKQLDLESVSKKKKSKKNSKKYGINVIEEFPIAEENDLRVYEKEDTNGKWYNIVEIDEDEKKVLLKKTRKKSVVDFIETLIEVNDEDDED